MRKVAIGLALVFGTMVALPATSTAEHVCGDLDSGKPTP